MTFRRAIKTIALVLPLVETLFDISTKAKALLFGDTEECECPAEVEDDDWEDVASEEVASNNWTTEIGGERCRRGDRLVLQRRRAG